MSDDLDFAYYDRMLGNLFTIHRLHCVQDLMRGNDTCCFTTEQYRLKFIEREPIDFPTWKERIRAKIVTTETALAHCRRMKDNGVLLEPSPDVWTPTPRFFKLLREIE